VCIIDPTNLPFTCALFRDIADCAWPHFKHLRIAHWATLIVSIYCTVLSHDTSGSNSITVPFMMTRMYTITRSPCTYKHAIIYEDQARLNPGVTASTCSFVPLLSVEVWASLFCLQFYDADLSAVRDKCVCKCVDSGSFSCCGFVTAYSNACEQIL
jgi:hypothetical protein